jgi:hypothetical protein
MLTNWPLIQLKKNSDLFFQHGRLHGQIPIVAVIMKRGPLHALGLTQMKSAETINVWFIADYSPPKSLITHESLLGGTLSVRITFMFYAKNKDRSNEKME